MFVTLRTGWKKNVLGSNNGPCFFSGPSCWGGVEECMACVVICGNTCMSRCVESCLVLSSHTNVARYRRAGDNRRPQDWLKLCTNKKNFEGCFSFLVQGFVIDAHVTWMYCLGMFTVCLMVFGTNSIGFYIRQEAASMYLEGTRTLCFLGQMHLTNWQFAVNSTKHLRFGLVG